MQQLGVVLNALILLAVAAAGLLIAVGRKAFEAAVVKAAEEGAQVAIRNVNWGHELAHQLEKVRGTQRQELRFKSYACLWKTLRPLAYYETDELNETAARDLSRALTDWYFSEDGGLMLTTPLRNLYFALQDVLHAVANGGRWDVERIKEPNTPKGVLNNAARERSWTEVSNMLTYLEKPGSVISQWPDGVEPLTLGWRRQMTKTVIAEWLTLKPYERYAVLQQLGSVLRTGMTYDVESRLR